MEASCCVVDVLKLQMCCGKNWIFDWVGNGLIGYEGYCLGRWSQEIGWGDGCWRQSTSSVSLIRSAWSSLFASLPPQLMIPPESNSSLIISPFRHSHSSRHLRLVVCHTIHNTERDNGKILQENQQDPDTSMPEFVNGSQFWTSDNRQSPKARKDQKSNLSWGNQEIHLLKNQDENL